MTQRVLRMFCQTQTYYYYQVKPFQPLTFFQMAIWSTRVMNN